MKFWIGSVYDASAYKKISDSLKLQVFNLESEVNNNRLLLDDCNGVIAAKNNTITASIELSAEFKRKYEAEEKKKTFWRKATFTTIGIASGIIILQIIKP